MKMTLQSWIRKTRGGYVCQFWVERRTQVPYIVEGPGCSSREESLLQMRDFCLAVAKQCEKELAGGASH